HQRAINSRIQEHVPTADEAGIVTSPGNPAPEPVRTLRMTTNLLGDGFVEVVPDHQILDYQNEQGRADLKAQGLGGMTGLAICVPVAVSGDGTNFTSAVRIGRFGWKCQEASLLNFSAG